MEEEMRASLLEDLLRKSRDLIDGVIAERMKSSVDRALQWTFRRIIAYSTAAGLFVTAAVFLLIAGTEALKQAGAPPWSAYLILGLAGLLGGLLLLRGRNARQVT